MDRTMELEALVASVPRATLAAQLRELLPAIDRRIKEGASPRDIVDALNRHGGLVRPVKLKTLHCYLFRYRRRRDPAPAGRASPQGSAVARAVPGAPEDGPPLVRNASDLRRLRQQEIDLEALARIGREPARTPRSK